MKASEVGEAERYAQAQRRALAQRCAVTTCRGSAEFRIRTGDCEVMDVCAAHAQMMFPTVPLSAHERLP